MSRRLLLAAAIGLTLVGALVAPAATAEQADRFTATIAPSAVQPLAVSAYTVQITNRPQSTATANNAHVAVPAGFLVDAASLSATTTAAGTCSAGTWTVGLNGDAIDAGAPDASSGLCPGARLTVSFTATAPAGEATYTWTTTLLHDSTAFSLQGTQPTVAVDGTPPPPPTITAKPSDPSNSADPTFAFSDGDGTATFTCQLDGGAAEACASPKGYSGLGEGAHAFAVTAIDPAGNASPSTSYGWTIDLTPPPAPTITSTPPSVTASNNASFSFTDDEAGAGLRCKLDSGSFGSCTSPVNYGGLSDGTHTFSVEAVDAAGNESAVSSYSWTVDATAPPAPTITSAPPSNSASTSATFSFTDADATATFRCRLDGGGFASCTSPITYDQLAAGAHTFRVRAIDPVGNESAVTTYSWTIDVTPPPAPTITSAPASVAASTTAAFAFIDGDATATLRCKLDSASFTTCTSPTTYQQLAEGTHAFSVKAVDAAGNESAVSSYTWTIDVTPPPAPAVTSAPPNVTDKTDATFAFTDGDGSVTFRCRLDGAVFSSCTSPLVYHNLAAGTHTFRVKAIDPAGNEGTVTAYTWTIDLTNPVVAIDPASKPPDPTNQTGASFVFTSNKANSTFECSLDGAAFTACTSPATYTALSDARHSFGVRATDPLGHKGLATVYEWTVDTVPPHAAITSGPPAVSDSPAATFEFSSTEAATFACSLDGAAFSACSSPQVYVGLVDGSHTFEVRGTDLVGNMDATPASYTWQVVTPQGPDTTPPGPVQALRRIVGYRLLKLQWSLPTDPDLAYVRVTRSRSSKGAAQAVVYQGTATAYSDRRFQNGQYYRYEIQAYDTSGNASSFVRVVVPPSSLLRSPRDGSVVKAPPLLLWAGVARATYYNVQVYRGAHKVLSAWPVRAKLKMRSRWVYRGRSYRLRKGGYRWWVWPAFGPRSKASYGQLLGTGTFVVR
jgi:large repetitive protein